ncbi:transcription factor SCREAM2-like [Andrographis paniculata]|uniref:transcription factor SCREAM2-like n=1 Tax=Andrographis paniculata TaxID=175694 RepID=UPI0021E804A6|nr:transcription factor SCREAM2-like [Andrographis paniculata]
MDGKALGKTEVAKTPAAADKSPAAVDKSPAKTVAASPKKETPAENQSPPLVSGEKRKERLDEKVMDSRSVVPKFTQADTEKIIKEAEQYAKDLNDRINSLRSGIDDVRENSSLSLKSDSSAGDNEESGEESDEEVDSIMQRIVKIVGIRVWEGGRYAVRMISNRTESTEIAVAMAIDSLSLSVSVKNRLASTFVNAAAYNCYLLNFSFHVGEDSDDNLLSLIAKIKVAFLNQGFEFANDI